MSRRVRKPGPKGLPLLGSLSAFQRDPLAFCTALQREHGDIAFFELGPVPVVQVSRPEWIAQLFVKEAPRLHKSKDFRELAYMLGEGLITSEDALWKHQRKLVQPGFHNDRVRAYGATMLACGHAMLERWHDGAELQLMAAMNALTLDVVGRALFGADMGAAAQPIARATAAFMDRFEAILTGWLPMSIAWPWPANWPAQRAVRRLDDVIAGLVRERRARPQRSADDLLGWLLEAQDERGALDDRQLRDELVTLMMAGHETTALALTWTLLLLGENPDIERKLVAEIDAALGGRPVEAGDMERLGYVRQVLEEGMRLRPPVWLVGREALTDIALGEHVIPKGTQILLTHWVAHHDPRVFPEPDRFDPDRFSPERRESIPRYAYFPFGAGPRRCIGANFAMLESTLLLAAIVQRFHLERVPGQTVALQPAVTLRPRSDIRVRLRAR